LFRYHKMRKLISLALLCAVLLTPTLLVCQALICSLSNQTGCGTYYTQPGTPAPTLTAWMADAQVQISAMNAAIKGKPQPKIFITGQVLPADASFVGSSLVAYGPYISQYSADMKTSAGLTTQDVFPPYMAYANATEYAPSGGDTVLPPDCANSGGVIDGLTHLAFGATPHAGSGNNCKTLAFEDQLWQQAHALGIHFRMGFAGTQPGLMAACSNPATEAPMEHCVFPPMRAIIQRATTAYGNGWIPSFQVVVEPVGAFGVLIHLSVADVSTFAQNAATAIRAISPATKIGVAYTGKSYLVVASGGWQVPSTGNGAGTDVCYSQDAAGLTGLNGYCPALTGLHAALDFMGLDLFSGSCSTGTYAAELAWQAQYVIQMTGGLPIGIMQWDPPHWCPSSGQSVEDASYLGTGSVLWQTSGLRNAFQRAVVDWASAMGVSPQYGVSVFFTWPWFGYSSDQTNTNGATGTYSALVSASPVATNAATQIAQLNNWWHIQIQGPVHTSGGRVEFK